MNDIVRPIFKNDAFEEEISLNGFVKIKLFSTDLVEDLISKFNDTEKSSSKSGFYASIQNENKTKVANFNTYFEDKVKQATENIFLNYNFLFVNFVVKNPQPEGKVGLHQDWTYVDEKKFRSVNMWFPLIETNEKNGGLKVLPKSHRLPLFLRSMPFDSEFYDKIEKETFTQLQNLTTKLGEVIIFDSRLLHCSGLNYTNKQRIACASIFIPEESQAFYYYKQNETLKRYKANTIFFINLDINENEPSGDFSIIKDYKEVDALEYINHLKTI
ncbi:MAG: hypothetical protein ACI8ZX_002967 [Planctomycetota bacterium]|jgi:hypothetical protein